MNSRPIKRKGQINLAKEKLLLSLSISVSLTQKVWKNK